MATKHGKKYLEAAKLVDRSQDYQPDEAIQLVKQTSPTKFDATVETHVRSIITKLGIADGAEDHRRVLAVLAWLGSQ